MRRIVCRCFFGADRSDFRTSSMNAACASSFGRTRGCPCRYPGEQNAQPSSPPSRGRSRTAEPPHAGSSHPAAPPCGPSNTTPRDTSFRPQTNPVIQRLATGGILRRPRPDNPGGSVADYSGAVLRLGYRSLSRLYFERFSGVHIPRSPQRPTRTSESQENQRIQALFRRTLRSGILRCGSQRASFRFTDRPAAAAGHW